MIPEKYQIISRGDAKAADLKHYFTGEPCSRGGIGQRYVSTKQCRCNICKDVRAAADRAYYQGNINACRERRRIYRDSNKEATSERNKNWRANNLQQQREYKREKYLNNRDEILKEAEKYRDENRDILRERYGRWDSENKQKKSAKDSKRRVATRNRIPSWFGELDQFLLEEAFDLAAEREAATGIEWHVDHMIPLRARKASGLHCAGNIQVIPAALNLSKNNKMVFTEPMQWLLAA